MALWRISTSNMTCYYPDGSNAIDYRYQPTSLNDKHSSCCALSEGDTPYVSGLCKSQSNYLFRGACTDPTWTAPECPEFCLSDTPSNWKRLQSCNDSMFCCGPDNSDNPSCCQIASLIFRITTSTSLATTATKTSSMSSKNTVSTQTTTATHSKTVSDTDSSGSSIMSTKRVIGIAVGVGFGVGLLVVLLLALAIHYWRRGKQARAARQEVSEIHQGLVESEEPPPQYPGY